MLTLVSIVASLSCNVLLKIFDISWNKNAKDLNEILDIDKKLDHKNEKVQELVRLHTAKYLIHKDEQQHRKREEYFATLSNYDGWVFYLGQITWRVILSAISVWLVMNFSPVTDLIWLGVWSFLLFAFFTFSTVKLNRMLSRKSSATPTKRFSFELRKAGRKRITGKIRTRKQLDGSPTIYDYIGQPDAVNEIHLYKRVSNKESSTVIYEYMSSREISNLEVEWATGLNRIKFFRRSSPYIPYILTDNRKWTQFPSAFHLVWKD